MRKQVRKIENQSTKTEPLVAFEVQHAAIGEESSHLAGFVQHARCSDPVYLAARSVSNTDGTSTAASGASNSGLYPEPDRPRTYIRQIINHGINCACRACSWQGNSTTGLPGRQNARPRHHSQSNSALRWSHESIRLHINPFFVRLRCWVRVSGHGRCVAPRTRLLGAC